MGRKAKFTPDQVDVIRKSSKTGVELATEYGVSQLTIHHIRAFKGAYREHVLDLGTPVLNIHGNIVGVDTAREADESADPLRIPAAHVIESSENN